MAQTAGGITSTSSENNGAITIARKAWAAADYAGCLRALDSIALCHDEAARSTACLFRARVLLRTGSCQEVIELLGPALKTMTGIDACIALTHYAVALARIGDTDRALVLLDDAASAALALGTHARALAEIRYYQALTHWVRRDLRLCVRYAGMVQRSRNDIVSVRGAQLIGFVASAQGRYHASLRTFKSALVAYRRCHERDNDLAATIRLQIGVLETQLRSKHLTGSHRESRVLRVPADARSLELSASRCASAYLDAIQFAHDGNSRAAISKARDCMRLAPTAPWRIYALIVRAIVSSAFDECENSRDLLAQATDMAQSIRWEESRGGESVVLLLLAESLAKIDEGTSKRFMARYEVALRGQEALFIGNPCDARRVAHETFVRGLIARAERKTMEARQLLEDAHRRFRATGWLWRAALSLIEIDATPVAAAVPQPFHLENAASIVREHFPRSFVGNRLGRWRNVYTDSVAANLRPAQRQVLRYALDGYSAKDIASVVGRPVKTIGNQVSNLHEAFGVRTTLQLVATCHQRGLGTPAWHHG